MVFKFFGKKFPGSGFAINQNKELAEELQKSIIRKFKKNKSIFCHLKIFGVLILQICN